MAKISVLLPVYNAEKYIADTLRSVLDQSFEDFELICIDDGSADDSLDILKSFSDPRVRIITNEKNLGLVSTLNRGLEEVNTPLIARMDADDLIHKDRFKWQVEYLDDHPDVDILSGYIQLFGNQHATWKYPPDHESIKARLLFNPGIAHAASMLRSSVFESGIRYSHEHPHMEDYDLWLRVKDRFRFASLQRVIYYYRKEGHNVTDQNRNTHEERIKEVYKKVLSEIGLEPDLQTLSIHYQIANWNSVDHPPRIYWEHIQRVISANKESRIYHQRALESVLLDRWSQLFYRLADHNNKQALKEYRRIKGLTLRQWYYKLRTG